MRRIARSIATLVLSAVVATTVAWSPAAAQSSGALMCLLSIEDMSTLLDLEFAGTTLGEQECTYESGTDTFDFFSVTLRVEDDDLEFMKEVWPEGEDVTAGEFPGWNTDVALWIDIGARLFVIQAFFFGDDMPETRDAALTIANATVSLIPADLLEPEPTDTPQPTFVGDAELAALFPTELAGAPLEVTTLNGAEFLSAVDSSDPEDQAAVAQFTEQLTAQGKTIDDVSFGFAGTFDPATTEGANVFAVRVKGADMTGLRDDLVTIFNTDMVDPQLTETQVAGKTVVKATDGTDEDADTRYFYVSGDVLWIVDGSGALLEEVFSKLP